MAISSFITVLKGDVLRSCSLFKRQNASIASTLFDIG